MHFFQKLTEFRKTSANSSIFIKTFWFFWWKIFWIGFFIHLVHSFCMQIFFSMMRRPKNGEVLMKIEGIIALSVSSGSICPHPPIPTHPHPSVRVIAVKYVLTKLGIKSRENVEALETLKSVWTSSQKLV